MTFRQIFSLIDEWKKIEKNQMYLKCIIDHGGDPDEIQTEKSMKEQSAVIGEALW